FLSPGCPRESSCGISPPFGELSPTGGQVAYALLTRPPLAFKLVRPKASKLKSPLDLHVLGTPPAFVLSQDQTLRKTLCQLTTLQRPQPDQPKPAQPRPPGREVTHLCPLARSRLAVPFSRSPPPGVSPGSNSVCYHKSCWNATGCSWTCWSPGRPSPGLTASLQSQIIAESLEFIKRKFLTADRGGTGPSAPGPPAGPGPGRSSTGGCTSAGSPRGGGPPPKPGPNRRRSRSRLGPPATPDARPPAGRSAPGGPRPTRACPTADALASRPRPVSLEAMFREGGVCQGEAPALTCSPAGLPWPWPGSPRPCTLRCRPRAFPGPSGSP